ncbi:MAG: thiamine phosphate synthase [Planctomycetaceae bacterium]
MSTHTPFAFDVNILRVIDAAANRGREGLRVLEDYTRFVLNSSQQTESLKAIRHRIAELMQQLAPPRLTAARDTIGDVGCDIHTPQELDRPTNSALLTANFKRVQEALRTLEEFGKRIAPTIAAEFGQLRYRTYTIEKNLTAVESSRDRLSDCTLCFLVTADACPNGFEKTVREALDAGCPMIQMREKTLSGRELFRIGTQLRRWTTETGALLIINDRPDIAQLVDADGVHLGQDDLPPSEVRKIIGVDRLIGVSTHNIAQAREAATQGADYLGVGPVFTSRTKQFSELAGVEYAQQAADEVDLPWFAIGGITTESLPELLPLGVSRIAISSTLSQAMSARDVTQSLMTLLASHRSSTSSE